LSFVLFSLEITATLLIDTLDKHSSVPAMAKSAFLGEHRGPTTRSQPTRFQQAAATIKTSLSGNCMCLLMYM